jgi:hypothetical protein
MDRKEKWQLKEASFSIVSSMITVNHDDVSVFEWATNGRSHPKEIMRSRSGASEEGVFLDSLAPACGSWNDCCGFADQIVPINDKRTSKLATTRSTTLKESAHAHISSDNKNTSSLHSTREGTTTKAVSLNLTYFYFVIFQQSTLRWPDCENWKSTPCLRFSDLDFPSVASILELAL